MNKKIISKIFGWAFIFVGAMVLVSTIIYLLDWKNKSQNYIEIYAYSNNGILEYENEGEKITPEQFYNYSGDEIFFNIPDKKSVKLYCEKKYLYRCIYFDEKNSPESNIIKSPVISIFSSMFLLILGLFLTEKSMPVKTETKISYSIYFLWLWIALFGLFVIICQLFEYKNYVDIANQKNIVNASVYSEVYVPYTSGKLNKVIAKYIIDGKEYTYVRKYFKENNIATNIKLYYDIKNPASSVEFKSPIDIELIIISFIFIVISTPFLIKIFPFKKMQKIKEC